MAKEEISRGTVVWVVFVAVILIHIICLIFATILTLGDSPGPTGFPGLLLWIATLVDGILVANLGALFGFEVKTRLSGAEKKTTKNPVEQAQFAAAIIYVVIVVCLFILWLSIGLPQDPDDIVLILAEIPRRGILVLVTAFAAILGVTAMGTQ